MNLTSGQVIQAERLSWIVAQIDSADKAGDDVKKAALIATYQATNHVLQAEWGNDVADEIARRAVRSAGLPCSW